MVTIQSNATLLIIIDYVFVDLVVFVKENTQHGLARFNDTSQPKTKIKEDRIKFLGLDVVFSDENLEPRASTEVVATKSMLNKSKRSFYINQALEKP